jgi:dual specificity protein kinase YAK1
MDQWQQYPNAPGAPRRFNSSAQQSQPHQAGDYNGTGSAQPPAAYSYEQYQGGVNSGQQGQSMATSTSGTAQGRDGNGDVAMQDAGDQYGSMKYPMRPHHQQHLSTGSRVASNQEQSTAAQRYSPMEALSPSSPYTGPPQGGQNQYVSRQSPSRPGSYSSPNSYYTNRPQPQQLPPITPFASSNEGYPPSATAQLNAVFGNDPKSPRRPVPQNSQGTPGRGPVPAFVKVTSTTDLQPKINAQPAFRRANPEGGFISVSVPPDWIDFSIMLTDLPI